MTINSTRPPTRDDQNCSNHDYRSVSAHSTSEGRISYQRCTCGLWRVLRHPFAGMPQLEAVVDERRRPGPVPAVSSSTPDRTARIAAVST